MAAQPTIRRDELVVFLKQRLGQVSVERRAALAKLQNTPDMMPSLRLDALVGETTMRVIAEMAYEELKERVGSAPESGVHFID